MPSDFQLAQQRNLSLDVIRRMGELWAVKLNLRPGDPLEPVIEWLGGEIVRATLSELADTDDRSLLVRGIADFTITIMSLPLSRGQLRVQLAHELGHYCIHFAHMGLPMRATRYSSPKHERVDNQANAFLFGLLMPNDLFVEQMMITNDKYELASLFGVPLRIAEGQMHRILALQARTAQA